MTRKYKNKLGNADELIKFAAAMRMPKTDSHESDEPKTTEVNNNFQTTVLTVFKSIITKIKALL